jgi:acetolactate synthase-1/2/3 large subunit
MKIAVSELIVRFMEGLGIRHIFGMPGAHILPVYDRLYDSNIETVLAKHEQGAAFMACGHARISGGIAACIATAGPGATNLLTGIANAYAEKLPVLAITGETSTYIFGKGGLQESSGEGGAIDQASLFKDVTRYHRVIERTDYLGQVLRQTANALLGPNPGPVLLSIPFNVQKEMVDEDALDGIHFNSARHVPCALPSHAAELAAAVIESRHPVIIAGNGCLQPDTRAALGRVSRNYRIPVATSLKGKGALAELDELSLGCLGVTSDGRAYRYIAEHADLLIFLGAGFNERTSYLWDARLLAGKTLVQVDLDPAQIGRVFVPDLAVQGDARAVLETLEEGLAHAEKKIPTPIPPGRKEAGALSGREFPVIARFFERLAHDFSADALLVDDNIIFAQSLLKLPHGIRYFPNTGISSLGHAIPAAIGARFAQVQPTFALLGDGGFQMCCMELMTAVNYRIPVNTVVLNNGSMGLIRKNQYQLYQKRYVDCDFANPDYELLARSFGIRHYRLEQPADVDALFDKADLSGEINLIEIMLDKDAFPGYLSNR